MIHSSLCPWRMLTGGLLCIRVAPSHAGTGQCSTRDSSRRSANLCSSFMLPASVRCLGLCELPPASQLLATATLCLGALPAPQSGSSPGGSWAVPGVPLFSLRDHQPSFLMSTIFKTIVGRSSPGCLDGVCKVGKRSLGRKHVWISLMGPYLEDQREVTPMIACILSQYKPGPGPCCDRYHAISPQVTSPTPALSSL